MRYLLMFVFFTIITKPGIGQEKEVVLATYTYSTNDRLSNLVPLAEWLTARSGIPFKAVSYSTVQALNNAILHDSVDFAIMNPAGYLVFQKKYPGIATPFVNLTLGNDSMSNYGGCLFALKAAGIQSVGELVQKQGDLSLALVNSSSSSGNLVPRLLLNEVGVVEPEKKFTVHYTGSHKKVVEEVLDGKAKLGGCGCAEIDSARLKLQFDDKAIVIGSFNNIPLGPVVSGRLTSKKLVKKLRYFLLALHKENPAVFRNLCNGWTEFKQATNFKAVADADYNAFRGMFGQNETLWKLIE